MDSYQDFDVPSEISTQPQPFIGFMGLDIQNNSTHKIIWEIFTNNRHQDRVPIRFTLFTSDFILHLPSLKPKRISYEWYVPKGIIKSNWINKHLQYIPSIIVMFYDLDWDSTNWTEEKLECASQIHTIRSAIEVRNIKFALVLIQKSSYFVGLINEENLSTEKASELCTACDINPKLLLLLNTHPEHLQGYALRLENVFYELAQNYYTQEIRNIKFHKDHLNKGSHQYLFVRHQFKIAFFNEMKQDLNAARKHYSFAYTNLLDIQITETNLNEIKFVAFLITYKLCKINFALTQPRDAISQFNAHIDKFRGKTGSSELIFEHFAWLSKQFYIFGSLFEEATRQGLPAVQTRHPGFYYEQAAQYALQRKNVIKNYCSEFIYSAENDPLLGWDKVEFYGQQPWRSNNRSELTEQLAITVLQYREKNIVNHSSIIINYLGNAITQFKLYRSPRKRRYLAVQMADEYYYCKDYGKALTLFTHMLWEYRNEKWWKLTADLLKKALNCAYLTASLQEYIERCVEAAYLFPLGEKLRIMNNIQAIIRKSQPNFEPELRDLDPVKVKELWLSTLQSIVCKNIYVDMHPITSFILCKPTFCEVNCDNVNLEIWLINEFPLTLTFSQLSVGITCQNKICEFVVQETDLLEMKPYEIKCFPYKFIPLASDIGQEIQLKYVLVTLGRKSEENLIINLRFSGTCCDSDISERKESNKIFSSKIYTNFCQLECKLNTYISSKISKLLLDIDHNTPCLISEWYPMNITIKNEEISKTKNCVLYIASSPVSVMLPSSSSSFESINKTCEFFENVNGIFQSSSCVIQFGDIAVNECKEKTIFLRSSSIETKIISFRVTYYVKNMAGEKISCIKEKNVKLECVNVFEITASFLSRKCEHISRIYASEPILMRMQVDCVSPWPIYIENTSFRLMDNFVLWNEEKSSSHLKHRVLKSKEIGAEVISFCMKNETDEDISLGIFSIYWKRRNDDKISTICTEVQLPQVKVEKLPLLVDIDISSPNWVRTPLSLKLTLQNNSEELMSFGISIEHNETDAFMFSGCKQMNFNIMPGDKYPIRYNLFPLQAGYIPLPHLKLNVHCDRISQNDLNDLIKRTLPSLLFIMPQKKEFTR